MRALMIGSAAPIYVAQVFPSLKDTFYSAPPPLLPRVRALPALPPAPWMQDHLRRGPGDACEVRGFELKEYADTKIKLHFSHFRILVRADGGFAGWPRG